MFDFLRWQICILSFMAVISAAVVVFESHNMAPEIIVRCKAEITKMRAATLLFVVFFWCSVRANRTTSACSTMGSFQRRAES